MFDFLKKQKEKNTLKYFKATTEDEIVYLSAYDEKGIQSLLFKYLLSKSILSDKLDDQQDGSEMDIIRIKRKDLKKLGLKKVKESKILRVDKIK